MEQKLHTPEGVRDIYNRECAIKLALQKKLNTVLHLYGYQDIQTPTFEYFDVFRKEIGSTSIRDLYKFFDREGNILALRPDITPSIARAVATLFETENFPIRLCYAGNTFINHSSYRGRLKENTQLGAELIGDDSIEADAEILAMAVECLKKAGLEKFQISIGHAGFLKGLMEEAGLNEEQEEELRELISNKNFFGVEEFIGTLEIAEDLKELFTLLGGFYDSPKQFEEIQKKAAPYQKSASALTYLKDLHEVLKLYQAERYISYELGAISDYHYYTGIIFSGYTFGTGEPIVKGGRYDKLLKYFGKDAPAIGFAIASDQLLAAIQRQKTEITTDKDYQLLLYPRKLQKEAILKAQELRKTGALIELLCMDETKSKEDYQAYADRTGMTKITYMDGE